MGGTDYIVIGVIIVIIAAAVFYIVKAKMSGKKCIGCPDSSSCSHSGGCQGSCSGCSSCSSHGKTDANDRDEPSCPHCKGKGE